MTRKAMAWHASLIDQPYKDNNPSRLDQVEIGRILRFKPRSPHLITHKFAADWKHKFAESSI
jgi:hypothetical protein